MTPGDRVIHSDPNVLGGTPVFAGTRVPVKTLLDYLEAGNSLVAFLDHFPSVSREQAIAALELAKEVFVAPSTPPVVLRPPVSCSRKRTRSQLSKIILSLLVLVAIAFLALFLIPLGALQKVAEFTGEVRTALEDESQEKVGVGRPHPSGNTLTAKLDFNLNDANGPTYVIANNDRFDWANVRFVIESEQSKFEHRIDRLRAGKQFRVPADQFLNPVGGTLQFPRADPYDFLIYCDAGEWSRYKDVVWQLNGDPTPKPSSASATSNVTQMDAITEVRIRVRHKLVSPSTAKFGFESVSSLGNGKWAIRGHVDSQNRFGAMLRTEYTATAHFVGRDRDDSGSWQVELVLLER